MRVCVCVYVYVFVGVCGCVSVGGCECGCMCMRVCVGTCVERKQVKLSKSTSETIITYHQKKSFKMGGVYVTELHMEQNVISLCF